MHRWRFLPFRTAPLSASYPLLLLLRSDLSQKQHGRKFDSSSYLASASFDHLFPLSAISVLWK
eukprot:2931607-Karenia_brevis.AAC.1